jgi:hypothetical protein
MPSETPAITPADALRAVKDGKAKRWLLRLLTQGEAAAGGGESCTREGESYSVPNNSGVEV